MEDLDFGVGAVGVHAGGLGVYEPAELGAVGDVFLHFGLKDAEAVGIGAEFDYEFGADFVEAAALFGGEGLEAGEGYPGGVGFADSAVGEGEAGGWAEGSA